MVLSVEAVCEQCLYLPRQLSTAGVNCYGHLDADVLFDCKTTVLLAGREKDE